MKLPPSVSLSGSDYPIFEIDHPACKARVALHGAQVMEWCPAGEKEVLYLSPDAVFREGKAIRGGIPICWPWFNAHPTNPELPSHGIARKRFWKIEGAEETEEGVTIRFGMSEGKWNAVTVIRLGKSLEVGVESHNPGDEPINVAGALHSYFRVGDIGKVRIEGLDGTEYLDTVGGRNMRRQSGSLLIRDETDSIYDSSSSIRLVDQSLGRTILIEKSGSPSTVVWNPWEEKSKALGDLPDDGYREFVCIEAAIANSKAVTVAPGGSHVFSMKVSVAADCIRHAVDLHDRHGG